ncbi:MAG: murein transglycosylase [Magnetovibrio sp.]|nr:murein transglycosylase [Magnetovibrio sp.]
MMMTATPLFRLAYTRPIMAGLAVGVVLLFADRALSSPLPNSVQAFEKEANTCITAIAHQERTKGIPKGLLQAISLAESGRWFEQTDQGRGEIIAWPWTVTTGGRGHYLPNRSDAVAFVKSLRADGVQNIDVGCMQINLKYHPDAFASIEKAFDARTNAAYAADFLKSRYAVSQSWIQAAGDYHSTTPKLNQTYRLKISNFWQQTAQADFVTASTSKAPTPTVRKSSIVQPDRSLTQRFNRAFQMRRDTPTSVRAGQEITNRVNALKPGANFMRNTSGQSRADTFAQRRQAQLASWRQTNTN